MVSQRLLGELQIILKEEYGKDVQNEEALQIGNGLVAYFDLLAELNHQMVSDTLSEEK